MLRVALFLFKIWATSTPSTAPKFATTIINPLFSSSSSALSDAVRTFSWRLSTGSFSHCQTWPPHFIFSNLRSLPATHCHWRLEPKIKFTILNQTLLKGTLRAMNFEKTDAKQVVMCFIDSLMVFIDFYFFYIFGWFLNEFYLFRLIF